jgi:predicted nucleic acid-binding protein
MASNIITVNQDIIQKTIEIRKKFRLKLPDAVIAATALVYDYTLISDNDKDFVKVSGLKYINPMKMD